MLIGLAKFSELPGSRHQKETVFENSIIGCFWDYSVLFIHLTVLAQGVGTNPNHNSMDIVLMLNNENKYS